MLNKYTELESQLLGIKRKYFNKLEKVLPPSKVFRFAQLDNRYDLATRVEMAGSIPLMSTTQTQATGEKR
jgi:hypothetical protein